MIIENTNLTFEAGTPAKVINEALRSAKIFPTEVDLSVRHGPVVILVGTDGDEYTHEIQGMLKALKALNLTMVFDLSYSILVVEAEALRILGGFPEYYKTWAFAIEDCAASLDVMGRRCARYPAVKAISLDTPEHAHDNHTFAAKLGAKPESVATTSLNSIWLARNPFKNLEFTSDESTD